MDMYLMASEINLEVALEIFKRVKLQAGFIINYEKTDLYRTDSIRNSNTKFYTEHY